MARQQRKCPDCKSVPAWMTTFSDLMSLLLTFFVLLLSFSSTHEDDFKRAMGSLQGALGVLHGEPVLTSPIELNVAVLRGEMTEARPARRDGGVESDRQVDDPARPREVEVLESEEGITIRISDRALFHSGQDTVKEPFLPVLNRIAGILNRVPDAEVVVEGHTDDVPISTPRFRNNYWLSSARALNVLEVLVDEGGMDPARLSAVGYGEFRPLADNDTLQNRARNRRVEIRVGGESAPVRRLLRDAGIGVE